MNLVQDALDLLANASRNDPALASLAAPIGQIKPLAQGDRITLEADLETTAELVAVPIRQAREAARRSQCATNLEQIGLAMHDYYRALWHFPSRLQHEPGWQAAPELAQFTFCRTSDRRRSTTSSTRTSPGIASTTRP